MTGILIGDEILIGDGMPLRAADRALRDEKKCFPLKDELLALGWASSRGNLAEGRRNTGSLAAAAQRTHGCARYNGPHWLRTG